MEVLRAHLIAVDIWTGSPGESSYSIEGEPRIWWNRSHPGGYVSGSFGFGPINPVLTPFWTDIVTGAWLRSEQILNYRAWTAIVELEPASIAHLAGTPYFELSGHYNALFKSVFPDAPDRRIHSHRVDSYPPHHIALLHLVPTETGPTIVDETLTLLEQRRQVWRPAVVGDVAFFLAPTSAHSHLGGACLWMRDQAQVPGGSHDLHTSRVTSDFLMFLECIAVLHHQGHMMWAAPLGRNNLAQYVATLENRGGLQRGYQARFLQDRQATHEVLFRAEDISRQVKKLLEGNWFTSLMAAGGLRLQETEITGSGIGLDIPSGATREFDSALESIRDQERIIVRQDGFLSDYLRDRITADATRADFQLQRRIGTLTWVTVAIALMTLVLSRDASNIARLLWERLRLLLDR